MVTVPDVTLPPSTWAMPCFPIGGIQAGAWMIRTRAPACGWSSSRATPTTRSGPAAGTAAPRTCPALAHAAPPVTPPILFQTQGQMTFMLSDVPGPTGGILLKTTTGALISMNDVGITISNGKGASIAMTARPSPSTPARWW